MGVFNSLRFHQKKKHNIVISSESFELLTENKISTVANNLKGFSVTVVMFYRPFVDRLYSLFNQFISRDRKTISPLDVFFDGYYPNTINQRFYVFDKELVRLYSNSFESKNVLIVDFHGAIAQRREPHQVIVCDVLKLCKPEKSGGFIKPKTLVANKSGDDSVRTAQLLSLYFAYLSLKGCFPVNNFLEFVENNELKKSLLRLAPSPTEISRVPSHLIHQSLFLDGEFRAMYSGNMLYGSRLENERLIKSFQYVEIQRETFSTDILLHKQFDELMKNVSVGLWSCSR